MSPLPKLSSLASFSCFLGLGSGCAHNIYFPVSAAFCALVLRGGCSGAGKFKGTSDREKEEVQRVLLKSPPTSGSILDFGKGLYVVGKWLRVCSAHLGSCKPAGSPLLRAHGAQGNLWSQRSSGRSLPSSQISSWSNAVVCYATIIEAKHGGARSGRVPKSISCSCNTRHTPV